MDDNLALSFQQRIQTDMDENYFIYADLNREKREVYFVNDISFLSISDFKAIYLIHRAKLKRIINVWYLKLL